jgi:hypothetical protein
VVSLRKALFAGLALAVSFGPFALGGCSEAAAPSDDVTPAGPLGPVEVLIRASLDVRGVRPTPDEVRAVLSDSAALEPLVDSFVDDPRFASRVRDVFADAFRTRIDYYALTAADFGLSDEPTFHASIAEEPLALAAWIAMNDRPYTDLVEAELTLSNALLASIWPQEALPADGGWLPDGFHLARYTDGRPHVGVLSQNGIFWRHTSTVDNANRGRSEALSRALLCTSWLERPIDFPKDVDLTDHDAIVEAVHENPGCTACHATLDPFSSHLWGFMQPSATVASWPYYHPEGEHDWLTETKRPPGYYGVPTGGLPDLGHLVARDPRFVMCAVERFYGALLGRPLTLSDDGALFTHREVFLASGLRLKALVRSVLGDPAYRGRSEASPYGGTPEAAAVKVASAASVATAIEALTGYRLNVYGRRGVDTDEALRGIAGGSDAGYPREPSTGLVLVHQRLAEAAAAAVVDGLGAGPIAERLATEDLAQPPSGAVLADLLLVVLSRVVAPEGPEVKALAALWDDSLLASQSPRDAWVSTLTALLADPELVLY